MAPVLLLLSLAFGVISVAVPGPTLWPKHKYYGKENEDEFEFWKIEESYLGVVKVRLFCFLKFKVLL